MTKQRICTWVGTLAGALCLQSASATPTSVFFFEGDVNAGHGRHEQVFTGVKLAKAGTQVTMQVVVKANLAGSARFIDFSLGAVAGSSTFVQRWFAVSGVQNCSIPAAQNLLTTVLPAAQWNARVAGGISGTVFVVAEYSAAVQQFCLECTGCDCSGDFRCDFPQVQILISYDDIRCGSSAECNDGMFCNGLESCSGGICRNGTPPDCDDGVECTDDSCVNNTCVHSVNDSLCPDDGLFCNGDEFCHATNDCISTGDPCGGSLPPVCDETGESCVDCLLPIDFPGTTYACDDSLSRVMNNVLRFQFACPISLPSAGNVEIRELLPNGQFGTVDLSASFTFTLEGTSGYETILRVEEDGDVLANETWYTVRNTGDWLGVANFQVDYASIYGDADNIGGTAFADLDAIYAAIVSGPDCSDDSRFDIDTLGCVAFADMSTAFNYIGSFATKPTGHDCSGSSQQSQGGGSSPESSSLSVSTTLEPAGSLTAADVDIPATFATWLPDFVSDLQMPEPDLRDSLDELLEALVNWAVENLTNDQRDSVAAALSDPSRTFADPIIAARARAMARAIAP